MSRLSSPRPGACSASASGAAVDWGTLASTRGRSKTICSAVLRRRANPEIRVPTVNVASILKEAEKDPAKFSRIRDYVSELETKSLAANGFCETTAKEEIDTITRRYMVAIFKLQAISRGRAMRIRREQEEDAASFLINVEKRRATSTKKRVRKAKLKQLLMQPRHERYLNTRAKIATESLLKIYEIVLNRLERRTVWIGTIPLYNADRELLLPVFRKYGSVETLDIHQKPGHLKSWALLTFSDAGSVEACMASPSYTRLADGSRIELKKDRVTDITWRLCSDNAGNMKRTWCDIMARTLCVWWKGQVKFDEMEFRKCLSNFGKFAGIDFQTYGAVVHFENRSSALKMEAAVAISAGSFQLRGAKLMACTCEVPNKLREKIERTMSPGRVNWHVAYDLARGMARTLSTLNAPILQSRKQAQARAMRRGFKLEPENIEKIKTFRLVVDIDNNSDIEFLVSWKGRFVADVWVSRIALLEHPLTQGLVMQFDEENDYDAAAPSEDNTVAFDASSYTQARNAWGTEEHTDIHAAAKDATVAIEESEETIFGTTRKTIKLELIVSAANIVAPTSTPLDTLIVICTDQNLEQEAKRAQRSRKRPSKRETFKQGSSMQVRGGVISAKKAAPEAHTAEGDDAPEAERYPRDVDERPPFTLVPFATKKQTKTRPGPPRIRRRASVVNRDPMDMFGLPQQRPTSPPNPVKSDLPKDHDLVKPKEQWVEVARTEVCQGESSPNFIRFVNLTLRAVDNVLQQQRLMMTVVQVNSKGKPVATIGHATFGLQDLCRTRWGRMTLSMVPGSHGEVPAHSDEESIPIAVEQLVSSIVVAAVPTLESAKDEWVRIQFDAQIFPCSGDVCETRPSVYIVLSRFTRGFYYECYRSNVVVASLAPKFVPHSMSMQSLCIGDMNCLLKIELFLRASRNSERTEDTLLGDIYINSHTLRESAGKMSKSTGRSLRESAMRGKGGGSGGADEEMSTVSLGKPTVNEKGFLMLSKEGVKTRATKHQGVRYRGSVRVQLFESYTPGQKTVRASLHREDTHYAGDCDFLTELLESDAMIGDEVKAIAAEGRRYMQECCQSWVGVRQDETKSARHRASKLRKRTSARKREASRALLKQRSTHDSNTSALACHMRSRPRAPRQKKIVRDCILPSAAVFAHGTKKERMGYKKSNHSARLMGTKMPRTMFTKRANEAPVDLKLIQKRKEALEANQRRIKAMETRMLQLDLDRARRDGVTSEQLLALARQVEGSTNRGVQLKGYLQDAARHMKSQEPEKVASPRPSSSRSPSPTRKVAIDDAKPAHVPTPPRKPKPAKNYGGPSCAQ